MRRQMALDGGRAYRFGESTQALLDADLGRVSQIATGGVQVVPVGGGERASEEPGHPRLSGKPEEPVRRLQPSTQGHGEGPGDAA